MATPEEKTALQGKFADWLAGTDCSAFQCKVDSNHITVIRVQKNIDFDYLYCQRQYRGAGIERGDNFDYAGILCKRDGLVFDGQYDIRELLENERDKDDLKGSLKKAVREAVEATIGNDRRNLLITELTDERQLEGMASFHRNYAPDNARKAYLGGEYEDEDGDDFAFTFRCDYSPDQWTEDSLLAYILDPVQYAAAETAAFIAENQEDMLADFLRADMVEAEYAAILANPLNPVHRVKRIMAAVGASAKTVTVTICVNDIDFTFKAEAAQFRSDCTSHYSDWNIVAADRKEYERLFGRSARYGPEDILRIEYARSVIYQAQEVPV